MKKPSLNRFWPKSILYISPPHRAKKFWLIGFPSAILCASTLLFWHSERTKPLAYRNPDNLQLIGPSPASNTMIPIGTPLTIPPWIAQQYHASGQADLYGDILNFMILNYGVSAPSLENKAKNTYYVPLTRYKKKSYDSDGYERRKRRRRARTASRRAKRETTKSPTVMVDVTKVTLATPAIVDLDKRTNEASPKIDLQPSASGGSDIKSPAEPTRPSPPQSNQSPGPGDTPPASSAVSSEMNSSGPTGDQPVKRNVSPPSPVVLVATEDIDTSHSLPVPAPKDPNDLYLFAVINENKIDETTADLAQPATVQATCDSIDSLTTAKAPCIDCVQEKESIVEDFLDILDKTTTRQIKSKNFPAVIDSFCENCEGKDVGSFFSYMEERAKQANVPKEILFAIMMRESNGDCNIVNDSSDSHGLFQLNPKNSTKLRACKKGELKGKNASDLKKACQGGAYRNSNYTSSVQYARTIKKEGKKIQIPAKPSFSKRPNLGSMICLENPYCNFEEALHLLTEEKWDIGNTGSANSSEPPSLEDKVGWADLSSDERNQWRNALIAYHGDYYHGKAKKAMRKAVGAEADLDDWELKRLFFIKQYLRLKRNRQPGLLNNIAYVESLAGRETKDGLANSSICQWERFRKQNPSPSCPQGG